MRGADEPLRRMLGEDPPFTPTCVGQMDWIGLGGNPSHRFTPTCVGQIDSVNYPGKS